MKNERIKKHYHFFRHIRTHSLSAWAKKYDTHTHVHKRNGLKRSEEMSIYNMVAWNNVIQSFVLESDHKCEQNKNSHYFRIWIYTQNIIGLQHIYVVHVTDFATTILTSLSKMIFFPFLFFLSARGKPKKNDWFVFTFQPNRMCTRMMNMEMGTEKATFLHFLPLHWLLSHRWVKCDAEGE